MWDLIHKINEQARQKQTHGRREQTDGCQMGEKGGGIKKYKLTVTI